MRDVHDSVLPAWARLPEVCVSLLLALSAVLWSPAQMKLVNGKLSAADGRERRIKYRGRGRLQGIRGNAVTFMFNISSIAAAQMQGLLWWLLACVCVCVCYLTYRIRGEPAGCNLSPGAPAVACSSLSAVYLQTSVVIPLLTDALKCSFVQMHVKLLLFSAKGDLSLSKESVCCGIMVM